MIFTPEQAPDGADPLITEVGSSLDPDAGHLRTWRPLFLHPCSFGPEHFAVVMLNLIRNPNLNSSWLFRADILSDSDDLSSQENGISQESPAYQCQEEDSSVRSETPASPSQQQQFLLAPQPEIPTFQGFVRKRCLVRRFVPRNTLRDQPLDQTCAIYESEGADEQGKTKSLVIYLPHVSGAADIPFYHPRVRGIAFLHEWSSSAKALPESQGTVSISYLFFDDNDADGDDNGPKNNHDGPNDTKLTRTALHLLSVLHKHGQGKVEGYVKRVQHDVLVPQVATQNRYAALKRKYARALVDGWAETTDPGKHVFEDLAIAAFLIELWAVMYGSGGGGGGGNAFPGFVDIGCGNGLLVYILNSEGFRGWGFDARVRRSWAAYNAKVVLDPSSSSSSSSSQEQDSLQQLVLLPAAAMAQQRTTETTMDEQHEEHKNSQIVIPGTHDGRFLPGTFIISNHADELTPWTPILAAASGWCPFVMIPCCSHNLAGERYRAPPPPLRDQQPRRSASAYSSLVAWVSDIAADCGWDVETEMLRIPSTRNTAIVGRPRRQEQMNGGAAELDVHAVVAKYGGAAGYYENAMKLVKGAPRGH